MPTKKNVRQGPVEVDFEESALVINYEVEVVDVDDGEVMERRPETRRVKIKALDKNLSQLAADIVEKCKYIHPSRVGEIEALLVKLRRHVSGGDGTSSSAAEEQQAKERASSARRLEEEEEEEELDENLPPANIAEIDDYLDMLYTVSGKGEKERQAALRVQVRGTGMILQLCRDVMNLEMLIQNSTVMGALTRVLQEEHKKSTYLTFNIMRIFLAFSNFMEMHGLMANYRVGVLTMKAVDFEVRRLEQRLYDRTLRQERWDAQAAKVTSDRTTSGREKEDALERIRKQRAKEDKKLSRLAIKQGRVLFVEFYVLFNLAEDVSVERKMVKKDLIKQLEAVLDHSHGDLLILVVTFLKKLSIYDENKTAIAETSVIRKLGRFLPCSSQPLVQAVLQLLYNLSFDAGMRRQALQLNTLPRLVELLKVPAYRGKALKVLYLLSVDDGCKALVGQTEGMGLLMGMAINFPQPTLTPELAALLVNLSHASSNVEAILGNRGLNYLMDRLDANPHDLGLLKVVRNVSYWTFKQQLLLDSPDVQYNFRGLWSPHFKQLLELLTTSDSHDVLVEVVGILANMTSFDVPANTSWARLLKDNALIPLFSKLLVPGMAQADLLLEVVMLLSAVALDPAACDLIASSNLIGLLYQLWKEKTEDVEILLQLIVCFHRFFLRDSTREEAMYSTRIVVDMLECLSHRNAAVRLAADEATELVLELDRKEGGELGQLGLQIRKRRFEGYNGQWLASANTTTRKDEGDGFGVGDYGLSHIQGSGVRAGRVQWRAGMNAKERLALDMDEIDAGSSEGGESWEESGGGDAWGEE